MSPLAMQDAHVAHEVAEDLLAALDAVVARKRQAHLTATIEGVADWFRRRRASDASEAPGDGPD